MTNKKAQFFPYGDDNLRKSFPYITITLIAINTLVFLWSLFNFEATINSFGFVPAAVSLLTIFTSMFLHGGIAHLVGNLWYLWIFGDNVEDEFGKVFFVLFYLLCGIAATLTHWLTNLGSLVPAIGASGAISGVLGSYVVLFPRAKVYVGGRLGMSQLPAWLVIGLWFLFQLFLGTSNLLGSQSSGIAFWAHIGGFIFGFLLTFMLKLLKIVKV